MRKLIAGPNGAYICDECIDVCTEILEEEFEFGDERQWNPFADINLLNLKQNVLHILTYISRLRKRRRIGNCKRNEGVRADRRSDQEPLSFSVCPLDEVREW